MLKTVVLATLKTGRTSTEEPHKAGRGFGELYTFGNGDMHTASGMRGDGRGNGVYCGYNKRSTLMLDHPKWEKLCQL